MAICDPITRKIERTECIGNSLKVINDNFAALDDAVCQTTSSASWMNDFTGIVKGTGQGAFTAAVAGFDYYKPGEQLAFPLSIDGGLTTVGNIVVNAGNLTVPSGSINGSSLNIVGNSVIGGSLTVAGATTYAGGTTFNNNLIINGRVTINETGNTTDGIVLITTGDLNIGELRAAGNISSNGELYAKGNISLGETFTITTATKASLFDGALTANGKISNTVGGLEIIGTSSIQGNTTVTGNLVITGFTSCQGDVIAFALSDKRLKKNVTNISNALDKISSLRGVEFEWDTTLQSVYEGRDAGILAQEVEEVLPVAVTERDNGYKAVKYDRLIPLLIEAVKELKEQNIALKAEIEDLKNKI